MRSFLARLCPNAETLNLVFGATIAAAINLLTALALGGAQSHTYGRIETAGWTLLGGSIAIGIMAVLVGEKKTSVLNGIGGTLTPTERRALVRQGIEEAAYTIILCGLLWLASLIFVLVLLASLSKVLGLRFAPGVAQRSPSGCEPGHVQLLRTSTRMREVAARFGEY